MKEAVKHFSGGEISREIHRIAGERVSANVVRGVMKNETTSARVSSLIARAIASLSKPSARRPAKAVAA